MEQVLNSRVQIKSKNEERQSHSPEGEMVQKAVTPDDEVVKWADCVVQLLCGGSPSEGLESRMPDSGP